MELKVYTIQELAKLLRIHRTYVSRLIQKDKIKAAKIGQAYRVMEKDLLKFLGQEKITPFYTIEAIALILKIHRVYVARLIAEKKIKATKIGRFYRIAETDFLTFTNQTQMTPLLTIEEVAETLKVHRLTVAKLVQDGKLKALRIGRFYRVPEKSLEKFLQKAEV